MRLAVFFAPAAFAATSLLALAARANDPVAGEAHFKKGKDLLAHGEVAAACAELELAETADPTVGTLGLLAGCHEQLGKLASARDEYLATEARAKQSADPRGEFARKQAARLDPKVPRVQVVGADPPLAGQVVSIDKKEIASAKLRTPLLVDPGTHVLEARADGRPPFVASFEAVAGVEGRVVIAFGSSGEVAAPSPAAPIASEDGAAPRAWSRPLGLGLIGVGAAALVVGGITGGVAIAKKSASQPCNGAADCEATRNQAFTFAGVSTATVIGGLVAAGAGVVLLVTAPKSTAPAVALTTRAGPDGAGLTLLGSF